MIQHNFPRVEINLNYLTQNVATIVNMCKKKGIHVAGVIKGTTGIPQCAKCFEDGGASMIASSRLEQLLDAANYGIRLPLLLLRIPMLSEIEDVIKITDISLNSELCVLEALNKEAGHQGKQHKVILMADLGDLREGFWDKSELLDVALAVENTMDNLILSGVGTNLGCYGSIEATKDKMEELVDIAEKIEKRIGRKLEFISGGATSSLPRILNDDMPPRINHLRIGEGILLAHDLDYFYHYNMNIMHQDVYSLKAEVIEIKDKPSYPIGSITIDAFGNKPVYVDRGVRKRALVAIGKVDFGNIDGIYPKESGVEIVGASSDHTILDIENASRSIRVGDVLTFGMTYASLVFLTNSKSVSIHFI